MAFQELHFKEFGTNVVLCKLALPSYTIPMRAIRVATRLAGRLMLLHW